MAGVTVTIDDREFRRRIGQIQRGIVDATDLMKIWGTTALSSVQMNFERGGRPPWKELSPVTIRMKGHARPLIGRTHNLQRITMKAEPRRVLLGAAPATRDYAAIQQFGGRAGRGRKTRIPARPYLKLQEEDKQKMRNQARRYLQRLGA